jgi:hypothetical protein
VDEPVAKQPIGSLHVILALGMAHVNDAFVQATMKTDGVTSAPCRDRARLDALQVYFPNRTIVSMNMAQTPEECAPFFHYEGSFGARGAKGLVRAYPHYFDPLQRPPDTRVSIYCDYVRFPSEYMSQAYGPLLREMLPALVQMRVFDTDAELIVPAFDVHILELHKQPVQLRDQPVHGLHWYIESLAVEEYSLYVVTDAPSVEPSMGPYNNHDEASAILRRSNAPQPFVRVQVK